MGCWGPKVAISLHVLTIWLRGPSRFAVLFSALIARFYADFFLSGGKRGAGKSNVRESPSCYMPLRIRLYVLRIHDFPYNPIYPMTWGWVVDHESFSLEGSVF